MLVVSAFVEQSPSWELIVANLFKKCIIIIIISMIKNIHHWRAFCFR